MALIIFSRQFEAPIALPPTKRLGAANGIRTPDSPTLKFTDFHEYEKERKRTNVVFIKMAAR